MGPDVSTGHRNAGPSGYSINKVKVCASIAWAQGGRATWNCLGVTRYVTRGLRGCL